jgi:hypothetical protein
MEKKLKFIRKRSSTFGEGRALSRWCIWKEKTDQKKAEIDKKERLFAEDRV